MRIDDEASADRSAGTVYVSASDVNDVLRRGLRLLLAGSDRVVVLTGAGISTDSGIPDYRGPSGSARRGSRQDA